MAPRTPQSSPSATAMPGDSPIPAGWHQRQDAAARAVEGPTPYHQQEDQMSRTKTTVRVAIIMIETVTVEQYQGPQGRESEPPQLPDPTPRGARVYQFPLIHRAA